MIDSLSQLSGLLGWWKSDVGLYDATSGGTDVTGVAGSEVARWEDQSGNGKHFVSTVSSQKPQVAGDGSLFFENNSTDSDTFLESTIAFTKDRCTLVAVMKCGSLKSIGSETYGGIFYGAGGATPWGMTLRTQDGAIRYTNNIAYDTSIRLRSDFQSLFIQADNAEATIRSGKTKGVVGASATGTITGLRIASGSLTAGSILQFKELALFNRVLSDVEIRQVREYFEKVRGLPKKRAGRVVVHGDANTLQLDNMVDGGSFYRSPEIYKLSRAGVTVGSNLISEALTRVDPLYDSAEPFNVAALIAGQADLDGATTAAGLLAYVKEWGRLRKKKGFKVICSTVLPWGSDAADETKRATFNGLLRAYFTGATSNANVFESAPGNIFGDVLLDLASIDSIGAAGAQDDTDNYLSDKLTLTRAGSLIAATAFDYAVERLLRRRSPSLVLAKEVVEFLTDRDLLVDATVSLKFSTVDIDELARKTKDEVTILVNPGDLESERARGITNDSPQVVVTILSKRSSTDQESQAAFDDLFDLTNDVRLLLMENELSRSNKSATSVTVPAVYAPEMMRQSGVYCSQIVATYSHYSTEVLR